MSHPDTICVHALFMRAKASLLLRGDEEAQRHARDLAAQADQIDRQLLVRADAMESSE